MKKEFVPLALNGRTRTFDDDECRFLEKADCGGQGRIDIITASGKFVARGELQTGNPKTHLFSLEKALKAWAALPEATSAAGPTAKTFWPNAWAKPTRSASPSNWSPISGPRIISRHARHGTRRPHGPT